MNNRFHKFAFFVSKWAGSPIAFSVSIFIVIVWAFLGPHFQYSDTWQLIINTGTTIVTFLMVFMIQNTQNRDAQAIHLKLDELIRATRGARNTMINLEDMNDEELMRLHSEFCEIKEQFGQQLNIIEQVREKKGKKHSRSKK